MQSQCNILKYKISLKILTSCHTLLLILSKHQRRRKKLYNLDSISRCYKAFYDCNLLIFIISCSVCPRLAFPEQSNFCGCTQCTTFQMLHYWVGSWPYPQTLDQNGDTFQVLQSGVRSWPYPQTIDQAVKAFRGQTLKLIIKTRKLQLKKVS